MSAVFNQKNDPSILILSSKVILYALDFDIDSKSSLVLCTNITITEKSCIVVLKCIFLVEFF